MNIIIMFLEKHRLIHYVISAFIKALLVSAFFCTVIFVLLKISGKYTTVESMLDLKYDSPWIIVPLLIAVALAALSFIIGMILYLYKYKRSCNRGEFYKALSDVLNRNEKES